MFVHEAKLARAQKRLNRLGAPDVEEQPQKPENAKPGAGRSGLSAAISAAKSKNRPKRSAEQDILKSAGDADKLPEYKQQSEGDYRDLFKQPDPNGTYANASWKESSLPYSVSLADRNQSVNQSAQLAPINGSFSPKGQEQADKEVPAMAQDMTMSRQLMRYGGMLQSQVPTLEESVAPKGYY